MLVLFAAYSLPLLENLAKEVVYLFEQKHCCPRPARPWDRHCPPAHIEAIHHSTCRQRFTRLHVTQCTRIHRQINFHFLKFPFFQKGSTVFSQFCQSNDGPRKKLRYGGDNNSPNFLEQQLHVEIMSKCIETNILIIIF